MKKTKKDKEWIEGRIQISLPSGSIWDDYISITIHDENGEWSDDWDDRNDWLGDGPW